MGVRIRGFFDDEHDAEHETYKIFTALRTIEDLRTQPALFTRNLLRPEIRTPSRPSSQLGILNVLRVRLRCLAAQMTALPHSLPSSLRNLVNNAG